METDLLMMENPKLKAGNVLLHEPEPPGEYQRNQEAVSWPESIAFVSWLWKHGGRIHMLTTFTIGISVYGSRKQDKGWSRYQIVIFQFLTEAFQLDIENCSVIR